MKYHHIVAPSVLLVVFLVGFPQISETIYTPALPNIANSLGTTTALTQWTLSIYFIGFALGVLYWGKLSDQIGRRPAMLLGIFIYGLANVACLWSSSIEMLLAARFIQAFGASVGSVITLTIAREAFEDSARHSLFSTIGMALSLTPALGPFIGGYVSDWFGWRANFAVLIIMTLALGLHVWFRLPETRPSSAITSQKGTMGSVLLRLLKDKRVLSCAWIIGAINGILFSYYAEAPFIFIRLIGISPGEYGWLGLFIGSASLMGSLLSRRLGKNLSATQITNIGCVIMLISSISLCLFSATNLINQAHVLRSILLVMLPTSGIILGSCSLIIPVLISTALVRHKESLGTASALFGLSYYLLIAFFTWLMGALHNGTIIPMPFYFLGLSTSICLVYYFMDRDKI